MRKLLVGALLALWLVVPAQAKWGGSLGDDNPYPLACLNFSGNWKSDNGDLLSIEQNECRWLKMKTSYDSQDGITTIIPDDVAREISGNRWTGKVRYRWNNKVKATVIETHRTIQFEDRVVNDLVLLEKVNDNLMLESLHRVVKMNPGEKECDPERSYRQRIFRLQPSAERSKPRR